MNYAKNSTSDPDNTVLPCLLEDGPASHDEFGSHEHIARGMASLIRNQEGGHVIGLRGPFGSGKSTTVAQLKRQLSDEKWSVITFDAWTHRGHDLMRAFLANIIKQLADEIGPDEAERARKKIIEETEVKTTQTQSTVNGWGQSLVAIGVLATVITAGLRASSEFGSDTFGLILPPRYLFWLGWTPWILLFLVFFIGYFGPWPEPVKRPGREDGKIVNWLKKYQVTNIFIKYVRRGGFGIQFIHEGERVRTVTTGSSAANSITFQDKFAEVFKLAVHNTDRRFVIVLDNMDRLEEDEQLVAWATIQAFVDAKFSLKKRIWFLVPLSYKEVKLNRNHRSLSVGDEGQPYFENEIRIARLRENLAEKIFLTEFRVPEVILTDWVAYVHKLCQKVLAGIDAEACDAAARVIVSWIRKVETRPKPRELRTIVNQIGGLYHQWRDSVPLDVIALYVIKIQALVSQGETLTDEAIIADFRDVPGRSTILEDSISQDLAMLHFSAPRGKALQILVHDSFSEAMTSGKPLTPEGLAIPGVETLLDHVAHDILGDAQSGSTILSMAVCLDNAVAQGVTVLGQTWGFLLTRFTSAEEPWEFTDYDTLKKGAEKLAARSQNRSAFDEAFARQIGGTLAQALSTTNSEAEGD